MDRFHDKRFPNEDDAYRAARNKLLEAEIDLRRQTEAVAEMRRALPAGGIAEDYVFDAPDGPVKLSDLFATGRENTLVIYSFMYGPDAATPCPMCTSMLDALDAETPHINDRINFAVVAKAPMATLRAWANGRGWSNLCLLSSGGNTYNVDYFAEDAEGNQWPMINVFRKADDGVRHTWGSELFLAPPDGDMHNRHADMIWPLWAMFDLTPAGRGADWYPKLSYD